MKWEYIKGANKEFESVKSTTRRSLHLMYNLLHSEGFCWTIYFKGRCHREKTIS